MLGKSETSTRKQKNETSKQFSRIPFYNHDNDTSQNFISYQEGRRRHRPKSLDKNSNNDNTSSSKLWNEYYNINRPD